MPRRRRRRSPIRVTLVLRRWLGRQDEIDAILMAADAIIDQVGRSGLTLILFAHPLTPEQQDQIETLTNQPIARVIEVAVQIDHDRPLAEQITGIADQVGLTPAEWQTLPLIINPPSYAPAAVALLAELHGRMGYFPAVLWIRPVAESTPPQFQVAEVLNLQAARDAARLQR